MIHIYYGNNSLSFPMKCVMFRIEQGKIRVLDFTYLKFVTPVNRKPNAMDQWLALLLNIQEDLGSNFGPQSGYPD
jgi:hypothetical protein